MQLYKITIDSQITYTVYANSEEEALGIFGLSKADSTLYKSIEVVLGQRPYCPNGNCDE